MNDQNKHGPWNIHCGNVNFVQGLWNIKMNTGHELFTVEKLTLFTVYEPSTWTLAMNYSVKQRLVCVRFMTKQNDYGLWHIHCGKVIFKKVYDQSTWTRAKKYSLWTRQLCSRFMTHEHRPWNMQWWNVTLFKVHDPLSCTQAMKYQGNTKYFQNVWILGLFETFRKIYVYNILISFYLCFWKNLWK